MDRELKIVMDVLVKQLIKDKEWNDKDYSNLLATYGEVEVEDAFLQCFIGWMEYAHFEANYNLYCTILGNRINLIEMVKTWLLMEKL